MVRPVRPECAARRELEYVGAELDPRYNPDQATGWNPRPTTYAEPPIDPGPAFRTNTLHAGGPVAIRPITTPNSSTGQPIRQAPSASQVPAVQTNRPGLLTPNSRTGAPGYQVPTVNPMTLPVGGAAVTAGGLLAGAPTTDQGVYNNANSFNDRFNKSWLGQLLNRATGQTEPKWGTATQTAPYAPSPIASPAPPAAPPPPPGISATIPPFNVSPRPPFQSAPPPRAPPGYNLGYGGASPAALPPPDPFAIHPSNAFTAIPRPNADPGIRGGMLGGNAGMANIGATYGPRGTGGAPLATALDLSSMFNHPAVAAAAAAHPAVQGALAAQNAAPARAPTVQAKWKGFPQVRPGGVATTPPSWKNWATGGATVGMGN